MRPHPDADKRRLRRLISERRHCRLLRAPNVKAAIISRASGRKAASGEIKAAKLRGVESFGMMCSIDELNLTRDYLPDAPEYGVYVFNNGPDRQGYKGSSRT